MPSVTQRISNYLGGVSKQSDDKMLPGQVRECFNGFPDATYGLTKRPGFKHIANLGTGNTYDNAKWFYINRDDDEEYIGCIKGSNIYIWNALTGVACNVSYGSNAQNYLSGSRDNYKLLTVQDTTIVVNNSVTVTEQTVPTFTAGTQGTVVLSAAAPNTQYNITLQGINISVTAHASNYTFDDVLEDQSGHNLKEALNNTILAQANAGNPNFTGTWNVTRSGDSSLDITRTVGGTPTAFNLDARGGVRNSDLGSFQNEVDNISQLPRKTFHGHVVKIVNNESVLDDYYAKFHAEDGVKGFGYWEETLAPQASAGFNKNTAPHELVNTGLNTFIFKAIDYVDRKVGDNETNSQPSFVGKKNNSCIFFR